MKSFKSFYEQLYGSRRRQFKNQVMQRTGWSNSTFYYKCDHENLTKLEDEVVDTIIARFRYADRSQERFAARYYQKYHIHPSSHPSSEYEYATDATSFETRDTLPPASYSIVCHEPPSNPRPLTLPKPSTTRT